MSTAETETAPGLPDYLLDPNAVLGDKSESWRYGRAPDYSKTRKVYEESKTQNHEAASLPNLVENLVKNWEVEASFKKDLKDWRTVDHANYTFAINGGPPQTAEHMLKVGTYNAIIAPNEYYDPTSMDFDKSHKTFKRMMPTFAWEVIEVYSGPPVVAFKWRHWGTMKNDYVGNNNKGEKIRVKAHGGSIDIQGITVAKVDDKVRLQSVETWFDPLEMFRQVVAGRGEDVITRAPTSSGSDSETTTTTTKQTPSGKVSVKIPSEAVIATEQKEDAAEKALEKVLGVELNIENSEDLADKLSHVEAIQSKVPAEKIAGADLKHVEKLIAEVDGVDKSASDGGEGVAPSDIAPDKNLHEKNDTNPHGHAFVSSSGSGSGCPFMQ